MISVNPPESQRPRTAGSGLLHGSLDDTIAPRHSQALAAAAHQAELHLLPCGHNDCPRPWPLVHGFLKRCGLLPPQSP